MMEKGRKFQRICNIILVLAMLVGMMPMQALATEANEAICDHNYENGICTECGATASPYLQKLPENIVGCTNLYDRMVPVKGYYTATKYDTSNGAVLSVVIPVEPGDRIAASSFGSISENMGSVDGIRVTYLLGDKIVTSLSAGEVYNGYTNNGYITVPDGVDAVCVPWWKPSDSNWLTLSQISKDYAMHSPKTVSAQAPTCTENGYTAGEICEVCNASLGEREEIPPIGHAYSGDICTICGAVNIEAILGGKYVSILGDSISTFNGYSNDATVNTTIGGNGPRYDEGTADTKPGSYCLLESVDDTWWMHFANRSGMKLLVNNSWAGSQVFGGQTSDGRVIPAAYLDRCVNLHDNTLENNPENAPIYPDVIFVYLGINDYNFSRNKVGTGTVDYGGLLNSDGTYVTPETFGEAYGIMLHKMREAYPDAQLFAMTLLPENLYSVDKNAWEQHNAYIRAAADYYDIPVVDLAESCAITWENYSGYMIDKIHPTTAGMKLISDCIEAEMAAYYKENPPHIHSYISTVTAPTCTEQGYTTYTCQCGESYVDHYVDAKGDHIYENGICIWCADWNICWEVGTIAAANGANNANSTRIRTVDHLRLSDFAGVCVNAGYQLTWLAYDADKNYIGNGTSSFTGYWQPSGQSIATADIQDRYADAVYFRLALKNISGGNMTLEDTERSGVTFVPFGQALPEPEFELEYENLINIGFWQDGAIWNGNLFVLGASGTGAVYDLENLSKLATFSLDSSDVLKPHANSVCFGSTYYAPGDEYPLLYVNIYNNYASAEDRMEGSCCVYRISKTDGGFTTELVQVIRIGFVEDLSLWKSKENNGDVRPYGNFLVDTDDNKLYAYVMRDASKATRFFKFDLPELTDGIYSETYGCNVVTLESTDIEGQFDTEYFNYLQGGTYSSGMILSAEGFNSGGSAEPAIRIVDLQTGMVSAVYYMENSGLTTEPEVVCIDPATGLLYYVPADGILRVLRIPDVHFHGYTNAVTAPTCTEQGYTTYTCQCGESYVGDEVAAVGHKYNAVVTAPTCTEGGYTTYTCKCGHSYVDHYTDAAGHSYNATVTYPVGLTKGYTDYTCTDCADTYRIAWLDAAAYEGKTIACVGDSITAAYGVTKDQTDYVYLLAEQLGMEYIRLGVSGTTLCTDGSRTCNIRRLTEEHLQGADIVTIAMGINDFCAAAEGYYELGDINSMDSSTIYGAARMWCERIAELRKTDSLSHTQFCFVTPVIASWNNSVTSARNWDQSKENVHGYTLRDLCNAIIEVAALYDVPVIDLNLISGMYYNNADDNNVAAFGGDGVHPGPNGHGMMADALANRLLQNDLRDDHAHTYGSWITTKYPGCEDGEEKRVCSACTATESRALDATGHSYADGACTLCGQKDYRNVTYVAFGDSITYGVDGNYRDGPGRIMDNPYPELVGQLLDLGFVNNQGVSGGTLCADSGFTNMTQRILNFNGEADVISIMLGVNDYQVRCPMGDIDSVDNKTIYGSLNLICQHLTENYPDAFLFFMTPFQHRGGEKDRGAGYNLPAVADAIKEVAAKYDIPVLDMYTYGRYEEEFSDTSLAYQDGIHPSQQHHINYTAPLIAEFLTENYEGPAEDDSQSGQESDGKIVYREQALIKGYCTKAGEVVSSGVHSYFTMDAEGIETITITPPDAPAWNPYDIYYIVIVEEDGTVSCYGKLGKQEPTVIELGGKVKGTVYFNAFYDDHPEYVYVKEAVVIAHEHDYEAVATEPACTEGGYTTYTCSGCGDRYVGDEVVAVGHKYNAVVTAPTCTEGGYTTYTCSACGDRYVGDEVVAVGHKYNAVVTAPTCTEGGYTTYTCSGCGHSYVADEVAAVGHKYNAVVTAPTCTEGGYTTYTCSGCGDRYIGDEVAVVGHKYAAELIAPTCTEAGHTTYTCSVCGDHYVGDEVAAVGHKYAAEVIAPTCTEGGHTIYTCVCGERYIGDEVPAKGHTPADAVKENETETGYDEVIYCSVCGKELSRKHIQTYIPGDINDDGAVNNKDVAILFQYLSGWDVKVNGAALDVNSDGTVNNKDVAILFQYLSGWDVKVNGAALDVNSDGTVNNKDVAILFQYLSGWDVRIH